jgi:hypothetical protein
MVALSDTDFYARDRVLVATLRCGHLPQRTTHSSHSCLVSRISVRYNAAAISKSLLRSALERRKHMAITPQSVGIVSTISFSSNQTLKTNFEKGVRDGNVPGGKVDYAPPKENLGYNQKDLGDAVTDFDKTVGVIVTVGGLPSAIAAKNNAKNRPFLSLIGGTIPEFDGTITGQFYGGINLDTFNRNDDRIKELLKHLGKDDKKQVCLLADRNTGMQKAEEAAWTGGDIIYVSDPSEFSSAFKTFDGMDAFTMIVSAAPLFQENKDALVDEANKHQKHLCYPLHIYAEALPKPKGGKHTLHGPLLGTAYYDLGVKVGKVLQSSNPSDLSLAEMGNPKHPK